MSERQADYVEYVEGRLAWLRRLAYLLCQDWHSADDLTRKRSLVQIQYATKVFENPSSGSSRTWPPATCGFGAYLSLTREFIVRFRNESLLAILQLVALSGGRHQVRRSASRF